MKQQFEKYLEMESEMSSCCCFLLRLLFLVQKTAHTRGAVKEPRGLVIGSCLPLGGYPFLKRFLEPFFPLKIAISDETGSPNGVNMKSVGTYFSEKTRKRKSVFGLRRRVRNAYEPVPWSAQGKNRHISEPFFATKCEHLRKMTPKRSPNG